jgi:hypothetical protein
MVLREGQAIIGYRTSQLSPIDGFFVPIGRNALRQFLPRRFRSLVANMAPLFPLSG